jgi:hypothetical protein
MLAVEAVTGSRQTLGNIEAKRKALDNERGWDSQKLAKPLLMFFGEIILIRCHCLKLFYLQPADLL